MAVPRQLSQSIAPIIAEGTVSAHAWRTGNTIAWEVDRLTVRPQILHTSLLHHLSDQAVTGHAITISDVCDQIAYGLAPPDLQSMITGWHSFSGCSTTSSGDIMIRRTDGNWVLAFYVFSQDSARPGMSGLYLSCGFDYATRPAFRGFFQGVAFTINPVFGRQLFGLRADEINRQRLNAVAVWEPWGARLFEQLLNARDLGEQLACSFAVFRRILQRKLYPSQEQLSHICNDLSIRIGVESINSIAKQHGVSVRTLERWFNEHVGLSPKAYARTRRQWHLSHEILKSEKINWSDIAYTYGFSDQAHMIREFATTFGFTPNTFRNLFRQRGHDIGTYLFAPMSLVSH